MTDLVLRNVEYLDRCSESGYRAYQAGIRKCAFVKGSAAHGAWKQGWEQARYEYENEPPED